MTRRIHLAALVVLAISNLAFAQEPSSGPVLNAGEKLEYNVKYGFIHVGHGSMEILGTEALADREAWHIRFQVKGGTIGFHVNDILESWLDTQSMDSLAFKQHLEEGRAHREYDYRIYPDRQTYTKNGGPELASVPHPLDEGSLLYYVRFLKLQVGQSFSINQYFVPDRNPVTLQVLRKERIRVPAGEFDTIVIRPIIKTNGLFSEKGEAELWFTDDANRYLVQMRSHLVIGSISIYLTSIAPGQAP